MNASSDTPVATSGPLRARALFVGERIDLRALERTEQLASNPLLLRAGQHGCAVLMRYGAVVLFGLEPLEEVHFLQQLAPLVQAPFAQPESEETTLACSAERTEAIENDTIHLHQFDAERLQLVAEVLAKSIALSHYEKSVATVFGDIEPLAVKLESHGKGGRKSRELLQYIGSALRIQHQTIGRAEIGEKPELLWEHPELERLYHRLSDEYELNERQLALDSKLQLVSTTATTLLDLLHNRRSLRVEWYITILIVVEILLTLYEMFLRH